MKKVYIVLTIALLGISGFVVISATSHQVDYEVKEGGLLSDENIELNSYVEITDKQELYYNFTIPTSFEKVAENQYLELYLERDTLAIAVRVKENGYVYASYDFNNSFAGKSEAIVNPIKSGVTLDLYKESSPVSVSYLDERAIATGEKLPAASSQIEITSNGFIAHVDFDHPELMIRFDLEVLLDNRKIRVNIPSDSITEYNPYLFNSTEQFYLLRNIVVFPYFGSTKGVNDGYVLIPDGSGSLITLDKNPLEKSSFSMDVYGRDAGYSNLIFHERAIPTKEFKRLSVPIYGMVHDVGNTGFYTTIESGMNYAVLNFKSAGVINDYYYVNFSFRYRESYQQYQSRTNEEQYRISFQSEPDKYDATFTYSFLSKEKADYVGIAKEYRNDLISKNLFPVVRHNEKEAVPIKIDVIGTDITMGVLKPVLKEITTYDQVTELVSTLQQDGYTNLSVALKTFTLDDWGYRFDVIRSLGGKTDFKKMLADLEELDVDFAYYLDYVRSYSMPNKEHAQTLSKREISYVELSWMFFLHKVNDPYYYLGYAQDDVDEFNKYGINSVALNGFDRSIYTGWDDGIVFGQSNMERNLDMLNYLKEQGISTGIYMPDSYLYSVTDAYYDAPLSGNEFSVTAASIPFLQLVLGDAIDFYSPYLNFASDERNTLLRLVEFGVYPSYLLTGGSTYDLKHTNSSNVYISEYDILRNRMSYYYDFIDDALLAVKGLEMTGHHFLAEGLVRVEYENGTIIFVNYNTADVTVDSITVPALDYRVIS